LGLIPTFPAFGCVTKDAGTILIRTDWRQEKPKGLTFALLAQM
jgi:hypothetical protein